LTFNPLNYFFISLQGFFLLCVCLEDILLSQKHFFFKWWPVLNPCHKIQHLILFLHHLLLFLISFIIFLACHRMSEALFFFFTLVSRLFRCYNEILFHSEFPKILCKYVPLSSAFVQYCPNKNGPLIYPAWAWEGGGRMSSCPVFCHLIKLIVDAG
jgi:hypothetical protein